MAYLGNGPLLGAYTHVDDISSGFDGSAVTFNITKNSISKTPVRAENFLVSIDGVFQEPYESYSILGSTVTFTEAPAAGSSFFGIILGNVLNIGAIPDGSVTVDKMTNGSVDTAQLVDGSVTAAKLDLSSNLAFADSEKATFGAGTDLTVYHDGSNSFINDQGVGDLRIQTNGNRVNLYDQANSNVMAHFNTGGSVDLYHNGSQKISTTSQGVDVTDKINIESSSAFAVLEMGGPSGAFIDMKAPFSDDYDGRVQYDVGGDGALIISTNAGNSSPVVIKQQNSEKLRTTATGINVTGNATFGDNGKALFGAGSDLQIYHDGSNSVIADTGPGAIITYSSDFIIQQNGSNERMADFAQNGAVRLYYDGNVKVTTTSVGADVTGEFIADSYNETYLNITSSSGTANFDCESGNTFSITLSENVTTTNFQNPPASGIGYTMTIELIQDAGASGYAMAWPTSVDWPSATAPTPTPDASGKDVFVFTTRDGGTTWYGFTAGQALA